MLVVGGTFSDWFQSAPPVKGAIGNHLCCGMVVEVSIRAPREGGDHPDSTVLVQGFVSIRAPREGGDCLERGCKIFINSFNPRPP